MTNLRLTVAATALVLAVGSGRATADDTIRLKPTGTVKGSISAMTSTEVSVDMVAGQKKQIPVNEIDAILYEGEPPEFKLARNEIGNSNFEAALKSLDKIDLAKINRAEIKQDVQFYKAFARARLALTGAGDVSKAGSQMLAFVNVKEHAGNWHYLLAAETLGDLLVAIDKPDLALKQYAVVERAPWPDYKMRAAVAKGRVLQMQKKYPEALAAFDAVLKGGGDAGASQKLAAQLGKAMCLAATGDPKAGIQLVQEVIDKADAEDIDLNGRAYLTLGNCYRQQEGGSKDALLAYLHVDLLYSGNREAHAEALANLSRLWTELGKPERSLQAAQLLKDRYAGSTWAK